MWVLVKAGYFAQTVLPAAVILVTGGRLKNFWGKHFPPLGPMWDQVWAQVQDGTAHLSPLKHWRGTYKIPRKALQSWGPGQRPRMSSLREAQHVPTLWKETLIFFKVPCKPLSDTTSLPPYSEINNILKFSFFFLHGFTTYICIIFLKKKIVWFFIIWTSHK